VNFDAYGYRLLSGMGGLFICHTNITGYAIVQISIVLGM
jgi:hypothetical protein